MEDIKANEVEQEMSEVNNSGMKEYPTKIFGDFYLEKMIFFCKDWSSYGSFMNTIIVMTPKQPSKDIYLETCIFLKERDEGAYYKYVSEIENISKRRYMTKDRMDEILDEINTDSGTDLDLSLENDHCVRISLGDPSKVEDKDIAAVKCFAIKTGMEVLIREEASCDREICFPDGTIGVTSVQEGTFDATDNDRCYRGVVREIKRLKGTGCMEATLDIRKKVLFAYRPDCDLIDKEIDVMTDDYGVVETHSIPDD